MKKTKDNDICEHPSCSIYKAPESKLCFFHRHLSTDKKPKVIDKFNPEGFKSQIDLFKYLWSNHKRRCFVTGQKLDKFDRSVHFLSIFAHILRKSAFKEFRLYTNNIVFLSPDFEGKSVHHLYDNGTLDQILKFEEETGKSFRTLFELEDLRYNEYKKEFGRGSLKRKIVGRYLSVIKNK